MKNFKSFRQATVPFAQGFTCIVGSNASGKSNVMDAVLFGLGVQSLKLLRASRLTDLVNHDARENYAVVTVELQDEEKKYEVSRTIDKQGKGAYRLNEKRVSLHEIDTLLGELGVRTDGHNFVVQGDITRIIEMNPVERRQVIDEIAGLKEFEEKKKEALSELEKVDKKIKEVLIVLNERTSFIEEMAKDKENALKFIALEKELKCAHKTVLHEEIQRISKDLSEFLSKELEWIEKKDDSTEKKRGIGEEISQLEKKAEDLNTQVMASKERAFEEVGKGIEELKGQILLQNERLTSKREQADQNLARIQEALQELGTREGVLKDKRETEDQLARALQEVLEQGKPLREKREVQLKTLHAQNTLVKELEEQLKHLNNALDKRRTTWYEKQSEREAIEKEASAHALHASRLETEIKRLDEKLRVQSPSMKHLEELKKTHPSIENELDRAVQEWSKNVQDLAQARSRQELAELHFKQLAHAKARCPVCTRELSAQVKTGLEALQSKALEELNKETNALLQGLEKAKEKESQLNTLEREMRALEEVSRTAKEWKAQKDQRERELNEARARMNIGARRMEADNTLKELEGHFNASKKEFLECENALRRAREKLQGMSSGEEWNAFIERKSELEARLAQARMHVQLIGQESRQLGQEMRALEAENKELEEEMHETRQALAEKQRALNEMEGRYSKALEANADLIKKRGQVNEKVHSLREKMELLDEKVKQVDYQLSELKIEKSRNETRLSDMQEEIKQFEGTEISLIEGVGVVELRKRIPLIEREMKALGAINMKALQDFGRYEKEALEVKEKAKKLEEERLAVLDLIAKIDVQRTDVFMQCFQVVNENFNRLYYSFFEGEAKLGFTNPEKPLEAGLLIEAKHSGEKLKNIDSMSGGEKSMTALAFLFAIQLYEPAPFYIFDEADAALDKSNSLKLANMIKELSKNSQFIAITHNDSLVKQADQIVGVTLNEHKSSVIGLKLQEQLQSAAAA